MLFSSGLKEFAMLFGSGWTTIGGVFLFLSWLKLLHPERYKYGMIPEYAVPGVENYQKVRWSQLFVWASLSLYCFGVSLLGLTEGYSDRGGWSIAFGFLFLLLGTGQAMLLWSICRQLEKAQTFWLYVTWTLICFMFMVLHVNS